MISNMTCKITHHMNLIKVLWIEGTANLKRKNLKKNTHRKNLLNPSNLTLRMKEEIPNKFQKHKVLTVSLQKLNSPRLQ